MRKIKEKLHSENGASFLLALVAFLVAAMVSVTIVAAAVSSLKRVYSDREVQQAHLTLTSAAQFVRDEMEATSVKKVEVVKSSGGGSTTTTTVSAEGIFGPEMKEAVEYVDTNGLSYSGSGVRLEVQGLAMEPVDITFTMKAEDGESREKYKVTFTFTLAGSDETLFLTMGGVAGTPEVDTSTVGTVTTTTTTTTITWSLPIINGIGA